MSSFLEAEVLKSVREEFYNELLTSTKKTGDYVLEEVKENEDFIAPLFFGGIGNILFQIASVYARSKDVNIRCVFGYFDHALRSSTVSYEPWGNHPEEPKGLTLKHVFPNLEEWVNDDSSVIIVPRENICFYDDQPNDEEILCLPDKTFKRKFLKCYAFNSKYWYHRREEIIKGPLMFNDLIRKYVFSAYESLYENFFEEAASVHLRLGYSKEPAKMLLKERAFPPESFFVRAFKQKFFTAKRFIIFSDDICKAKEFVKQVSPSLPVVFVEGENAVTSLYMMSRCKHHVLNSSTLSLWGAFLDEKQLTDQMGTTVYHKSLFVDHGEPTIPPEFRKRWLCIWD